MPKDDSALITDSEMLPTTKHKRTNCSTSNYMLYIN